MIDLTEMLEEHSQVAGPPAGERLSAVERRIVRRRRRRVAGAGTGLLAVAVAVAIVLPRLGEPAPTVQSASSPRSPSPSPAASASARPPTPGGKIGPFTEFADGYRVVAVGSAPVTAGRARVSWPVGSTDVQLFTYCPGLPDSLDGEFSIGGTPIASVGCGAELHQDANDNGMPGVPGALTVGQTATIDYRITGAQAGDRKKSVHVAVAERVPFTEFPLPPRPAVLKTPTPDGIGTEPGGKILHSNAGDLQKTTTMVWHYGNDVSFAVLPSTPGIYTVAIDGVTVGTTESYDYRGGGKGWTSAIAKDGSHTLPGLPKIADGKTVTVTFTAQHATGPWIGEVNTTSTNPNGHG